MDIKTRAIVLSAKDANEKDKIIRLFSLEYGIIACIVKSVKKDTAKLKFAKEPFSFGDFIINKGKTNIVTGFDAIETFFSLSQDMQKYCIGCIILDSINKTLGENNPNNDMFVLVLKTLGELCFGNSLPKICLTKYLIKFFEISGYQLNFDCCSSCGGHIDNKRYLNLDSGEIVCTSCKKGYSVVIDIPTNNTFKLINKFDFSQLDRLNINEEQLNKCLAILDKNFSELFSPLNIIQKINY